MFVLSGEPEYYKSYLRSALGSDYADAAFTVEKKADAKYRVVSAASIIAKVVDNQLAFVSIFKS